MKLHQAILMLLPLLTRRRNSRRYSWSGTRRRRSGRRIYRTLQHPGKGGRAQIIQTGIAWISSASRYGASVWQMTAPKPRS